MPPKCPEAKAAYYRAYYLANRDKRLKQSRERYAANREKILAYYKEYAVKNRDKIIAYKKAYHKAHPEVIRDWDLRNKFGITLEEFNKIFDAQRGKCALCGEDMERNGLGHTTRKAVVDHDHKTGKTRGLIHGVCNLLLGAAGDDTDVLRKAAIYLEARR